MNIKISFILCICLFYFSPSSFASDKKNDPHYTSKGFFDIHVCNWPDRPLFLMGLFSTTFFSELKSVEIFTPDNISIGKLDLNKFRQFKNKKKQLKRAFIRQFKLPKHVIDGWYKATITLKNNEVIHSRDMVQHKIMDIPGGLIPANNSENITLPDALHWGEIKSAKFYQVFIKDLWQDDKVIYQSKLLNQNKLVLPKKLLQKGGYYSWRVHARDINEDINLGDFNHGSLSAKLTFSIQE